MSITAFVDALKKHLEETESEWTVSKEMGDTESGFWDYDGFVDIDKLNAQIDEFAKKFK